MVNTLKINS